MTIYLIQAYSDGVKQYEVVVETLDRVKTEVADGLNDGFDMYVTKGTVNKRG